MKKIFVPFLLLFASPSFSESDQPANFLLTGSVLDVDVNIDLEVNEIRRGWMALHQSNDDWLLSRTKVKFDRSEEDVVDIKTEYKNVVGLLNFNFLKSGVVESAKITGDYRINNQKVIFRKKQYQLEVKTVESRNKVYFSNGIIKTLIYGGTNYRSCKNPEIKWAGDIDRDNKLDLIVGFDDDGEKNSSTCVFFSKLAKGNVLLKEGGCQFFSG